MSRGETAVALALLAFAPAGASAQALYRCTGVDGRVTYQQTSCKEEFAQRRLYIPTRPAASAEIEARRLLEREASRGDALAGEFARSARERELARQRELEAKLREERLRRLREEEAKPVEEVPWNPAWGFPARPGLARPPAKPAN